MPNQFGIARLPRIEFGPGVLGKLPVILLAYGPRTLIVTGAQSFVSTPHWLTLTTAMANQGLTWHHIIIDGEPSPQQVDATVSELSDESIDSVVGIGGGSALDAGKAIAGLLRPGNSVMDHLEGVGPELPYLGPATPFIAVPTTAGTGSEATKNAVLSLHGEQGFKKSFRDEKLVAEYALVDPDLLTSCPRSIIAANGMDALTQLLESYVSSKSNPLTDALALSGLGHVRDSLLPWYEGVGDTSEFRSGMAYGALLSGITLAQVGLGSVHGLAAPLGAFFPIPHGVACGTLLAQAVHINLVALACREPNHGALSKYAHVGRLLVQRPALSDVDARTALVDTLEEWTQRLNLPRLSAYGIQATDIARIVANSRGSSMKTNPLALTDDEVSEILRARI